MQLIARLQRVFTALDESGVEWCLLRPTAMLRLPAGDIDLMIEPSGRDCVRSVIEAEQFTLVPVPGNDLHAADYDPDSDRYLWLHVQSEYRVASDSVPASAILATVERDPWPRPQDDWLFWILLLHDLLDKRAIPERHRAELTRLAAFECGRATPLRELAVRYQFVPESLLDAVRGGRWQELARVAHSRPGSETPPRWRAAIGALRVLRQHPRRGVLVGIIGPDGAGKTTLVEALSTSLPVPSRSLYMGLTGGRLPKADALRMPGLVLAARLVLLWLRYGLALYHRLRGRIVLFDRYTLDGMVPSGASISRAAQLSRRLQAVAVPPPDLLLLLDASGDSMHRRKGEYTPRQLDEWRAAYGRLQESARSLEVIDAERPPDAVRRDAQRRILRCYLGRWQPG